MKNARRDEVRCFFAWPPAAPATRVFFFRTHAGGAVLQLVHDAVRGRLVVREGRVAGAEDAVVARGDGAPVRPDDPPVDGVVARRHDPVVREVAHGRGSAGGAVEVPVAQRHGRLEWHGKMRGCGR